MKNWLELCNKPELSTKIQKYQQDKARVKQLRKKLHRLAQNAKKEGFYVCTLHPEHLGSVFRCYHDECKNTTCRKCTTTKCCDSCVAAHVQCVDCTQQHLVCQEMDSKCGLCQGFLCEKHFFVHEC